MRNGCATTIIAVLACLLFVAWAGGRIIADIQFERGCEGYLKRAADANTVEMAKKELDKALSYMRKESLTEGYTSILWQTPDEDVGYWYQNISEARKDLNTITEESSGLERSNMLMKLRETLLDNSAEGGTVVTSPAGITVYPNNGMWAFFGVASFIIALVGVIVAASFGLNSY